MGLAENRAIKSFEDNNLEYIRDELKSICGFDVAVEIHWESFDSIDAIQTVYSTCFQRTQNALRGVCYDELGKQALEAKLTKIVVDNVSEEGAKRIALGDGALTLAADWAGSSVGYFTDKEIQAALEAEL